MKFIFDFDDVLFENTKKFKPHMYEVLGIAGISKEKAEAYYKEVRTNQFSLKDFINTLTAKEKTNKKPGEIYEEIMSKCKDFLNSDLMNIVKKIGKSNTYIVTNGEEEFQKDKIGRSGIAPLFSQIHIVPGSKREVIKDICSKNSNEKMIFLDDKEKFVNDLDETSCPNLTAVIWDEKGLEKVNRVISLS